MKVFRPGRGRSGETDTGIIHQCDLCGRKDFWHDSWSWYGSVLDEEEDCVFKTCGCRVPYESEAAELLKQKRKKKLGRARHWFSAVRTS